MQRLTYRDKDGHAMMDKRGSFRLSGVDRLAAYEDTGLEPDGVKALMDGSPCTASFDIGEDGYLMVIERSFKEMYGCSTAHVQELLEAEKHGRLVVLPRKVGDTVWVNFSIAGSYLQKKNRPYPCTVLFVGLNQSECGGFINYEYQNCGYQFQSNFSDFGKSIFLSEQEAKAALRKEHEKCR